MRLGCCCANRSLCKSYLHKLSIHRNRSQILNWGSKSVVGQTRRSDRAPFTSGLPRKADKFRARWHFAFVPSADSCTAAQSPGLFDYLVGAGEKQRRQFEAERLRGLEIDNQIELGWLLHGHVSGICTAQNLVDIIGCASEHLPGIWSIRYQTSAFDILSKTEYGRHLRGERQFIDTNSISVARGLGGT